MAILFGYNAWSTPINPCTHLAARLEGTLALAAGEALLVVGLAQRGHHLALDVLAARGAFGAVQLLVVGGAVVVALLAEEAALGQRLVALGALEAGLVEVPVSHPQHLARALLLAPLAVYLRLSCIRDKNGLY